MKTNYIKTGILIILVGAFTGCQKYKDGPLISFASKEERVSNTWIVEKAYADNADVSKDYDQYEIYLANDGDAELSAHYTVFGVTYSSKTSGSWNFTNDKSNILINYSDDSQDAEYQILRLTEQELWLQEIGQDLELHLKEK